MHPRLLDWPRVIRLQPDGTLSLDLSHTLPGWVSAVCISESLQKNCVSALIEFAECMRLLCRQTWHVDGASIAASADAR